MDKLINHPSTDNTQQLLITLVTALVDEPDGVTVRVVEGHRVDIFEVIVAKEDIRRLIGRKGRTADALRVVLLNLGSKVGRRYELEIVEPSHQITVALPI